MGAVQTHCCCSKPPVCKASEDTAPIPASRPHALGVPTGTEYEDEVVESPEGDVAEGEQQDATEEKAGDALNPNEGEESLAKEEPPASGDTQEDPAKASPEGDKASSPNVKAAAPNGDAKAPAGGAGKPASKPKARPKEKGSEEAGADGQAEVKEGAKTTAGKEGAAGESEAARKASKAKTTPVRAVLTAGQKLQMEAEGNWADLPEEEMKQIMEAYSAGKSKFDIQVDGKAVAIDLSDAKKMTYSVAGSEKKAPLRIAK